MAAFINALTLLLWKKAIVEQGVIGLDFSDFEKTALGLSKITFQAVDNILKATKICYFLTICGGCFCVFRLGQCGRKEKSL